MNIIELTEYNSIVYESYIGEDMAENLERTFYRGLIALDGEDPCAAMVWEYKNLEEEGENESVIRLFLASDDEAAEDMLEVYGEKIREEDVVRSSVVIPVKDRKPEKELLLKAGFPMKLTESDDIVVSLAELSAMPLMKTRKVPKGIAPLTSVTVRQFRKGIAKCTSMGRKGLCEDLGYLPMSYFDNDVSCCYEKDGEIQGFLLFHPMPSGILSIKLMICLNKNVGVILPGLMRQFVTEMEKKYPEDHKIMFDRHNEQSLKLQEKLLPRGFGIPVYAGTREERA